METFTDESSEAGSSSRENNSPHSQWLTNSLSLSLEHIKLVGSKRNLEEITAALDEEVTELVDQLTGIQRQLEVISIVSTTGKVSSSILARKVFDHPLIKSHFQIRAQSISFRKRRKRSLMIHILESMGCSYKIIEKMSDENLGNQLYNSLMGLRFIILIENPCDNRALDDFKSWVPDNQDGSKILFTNWDERCYGQPRVLQQTEGTPGVRLYHVRAQVSFPDKSLLNRRMKEEQMVGLEDAVVELLDRLTGPGKQLEVISIVGMPGLGKTTLAKQVYNHPSVVYHFYIRAWTRVSQVYRKRDLLLGILGSVIKLTSEIHEMSDGKLLELLKKRLLGQRYLVVMDDIWDDGAWNDLQRCFPDDKNGSKIVFTSRMTDAALHAQLNSNPCNLRFLTDSESWELLRQKVFQTKHCPSELKEIGLQIAKKCRGLPLAIVVIAGILANEKTLPRWTEVAQSVSCYIVDNPEKYMDTLALSYNHLPLHLKACFLYLGAFLEDREIPVRKLIWLWIAEGFIHPSGCKILEDVAEDYLMELINRNLIVVSHMGSNGRIKSCIIIHDLLRELCLRKANEENFMQQLYKYDEKSFSSSPFTDKPIRLCIHSAAFPHSSLKPFAPNAKSLLCFAVDVIPDFTPFICQTFQFLRVLELTSIKIPFFPREIVQLVELRYISLQVEVGSPPSSISDLQYLETLIVSPRSNITLPKNIGKMVNLRHLCIKQGINEIEDISSEEVQGNDGHPLILKNLQTLSFVWPSQSCQDVLARAPHLRKLGFYGPLISASRNLSFPSLDFLNHLEELKLFNTAFYREPSNSCDPIKFPERLKRLSLTYTALAWNEMQTLGMLPNLEVLKLKFHACLGQKWDTSDGGFGRLKFLKFEDLGIVQWTASNNHFPCLQQLVLRGCRKLEEIPSSLGDIPTLEMIVVRWCSQTTANSAREIKKDQESMGNDWMKIIIEE